MTLLHLLKNLREGLRERRVIARSDVAEECTVHIFVAADNKITIVPVILQRPLLHIVHSNIVCGQHGPEGNLKLSIVVRAINHDDLVLEVQSKQQRETMVVMPCVKFFTHQVGPASVKALTVTGLDCEVNNVFVECVFAEGQKHVRVSIRLANLNFGLFQKGRGLTTHIEIIHADVFLAVTIILINNEKKKSTVVTVVGDVRFGCLCALPDFG